MVFSSLEFIFVFLASVLAVYYLVPPKARNIVLLLFSLVFYGWGEPVYVFLMIATITVDYICGYIIGRDLDSKPKRAKVTLIVSIVINLALLGVFKYYDFFAGTLNSLLGRGVFPTLGLTLPIGISFYTFQALSYVIDVYRGDVTAQRKNEEMRREFVANVSHELRTPLTNIRSYAETLADSAGQLAPATEKKFLGVILNESDRMTHIVQDLLTLSRLDSGRDELKLARFSFGQAVQDLYNAVYMEAQRHGHALTLSMPDDLPQVVADRERILQVMMNVVSNAIKYTPDGGKISISAGRTDRQVWMLVDDNGIGIPAADRDRIFERFYRVDKSRSKEVGGTGLGLSIVKHAAFLHKAAIDVTSQLGAGTTIQVRFPIQ